MGMHFCGQIRVIGTGAVIRPCRQEFILMGSKDLEVWYFANFFFLFMYSSFS